MNAAQISEAGGPFELVDRDIPTPGAGEVLIAVEACGICHSDAFVKEGTYPGVSYPQIPGHEVAGRIESVGENVFNWSEGDRVGVGWHGGHCHHCEACRAGDFINCENALTTGISFDGGYAEYMAAPQEALARLPDDLEAADAAPLLCAGITTFNGLRNSRARPGDTVAVQGIGGLGHLGIQFAHAMGFHTIAISGTSDKEELARELGADDFIDASATNPGQVLSRTGGARVILTTVPSASAMENLIPGIGRNGQLLIVGAAPSTLEVPPMALISGRKSVAGWASGTAKDSEDTLQFSALHETLPRIETYPLEEVDEAYDRMINNEARFRVVLEP